MRVESLRPSLPEPAKQREHWLRWFSWAVFASLLLGQFGLIVMDSKSSRSSGDETGYLALASRIRAQMALPAATEAELRVVRGKTLGWNMSKPPGYPLLLAFLRIEEGGLSAGRMRLALALAALFALIFTVLFGLLCRESGGSWAMAGCAGLLGAQPWTWAWKTWKNTGKFGLVSSSSRISPFGSV